MIGTKTIGGIVVLIIVFFPQLARSRSRSKQTTKPSANPMAIPDHSFRENLFMAALATPDRLSEDIVVPAIVVAEL
jgi:hypothetical protein